MHSLTRLDNFEAELATLSGLLAKLSDKHAMNDYSVKQITNTTNEIEDKSEKIEKQVDIYKEMVYDTRQALEDFQEHLKAQRQFNMISNIRGHLIWRVNNFSRKLAMAREAGEIPIKSPLFSNKHYGYALRLDV